MKSEPKIPEKELRERIREIYRPIMNNDPPFKEEIDFGVACFKAGQADALKDSNTESGEK